MAVLADPEREFASSNFVMLETLPKALYNGYTTEAEFYEEFFRSVEFYADICSNLVDEAFMYAKQHGLSAVDALHVAAASITGSDELITTEKSQKPICKISEIKVLSLDEL